MTGSGTPGSADGDDLRVVLAEPEHPEAWKLGPEVSARLVAVRLEAVVALPDLDFSLRPVGQTDVDGDRRA